MLLLSIRPPFITRQTLQQLNNCRKVPVPEDSNENRVPQVYRTIWSFVVQPQHHNVKPGIVNGELLVMYQRGNNCLIECHVFTFDGSAHNDNSFG